MKQFHITIPIKSKLPKINKSIFVEERKILNSFKKRKNSFSGDIENHPLFRKRTVRLKEQKMKNLIEKNHSKFFKPENSLSEISSIKTMTKDFFSSKNSSYNMGNKSTYFQKTKPKLKEKKIFLKYDWKMKLNYSRYLYIKNDEIFLKYIIDRFLSRKRITSQLNSFNNAIINNKNMRKIYVVLQNTIITNYNDIPGCYINIPSYPYLKFIEVEKRTKMYNNLLKQITAKFECKRKIESIFSPNKDIILDLIDIKKEYKFIYVSNTIMCKSISIVISPGFINLYNNDFQDYLYGIKSNDYNIKKNLLNKKTKNKFKIKNITKGIKPKFEKLKPHYSFSNGEDDIENINYIYYSDDEEKKKIINKEKNKYIKNNSIKNDFFLYLHEREINAKLTSLKENLNYDKSFNLKESYDNFSINFEKLISRFGQEVKKKYGLNPKNFNTVNPSQKNENYDFRDLDNKFDKLFIQKNGDKIKLNNKFAVKSFTNVDRKVNKQYSHLVLYNIPKISPDFNTRKTFFEIFAQFKDLLAIALLSKKNDYILKNGLDFDTFYSCIAEIQDESENFAKKLFSNMNKSNSSVLNIKDFINGMNSIKKSDLSDKIQLYLNSMDIFNKDEITFKEAIKISRESILKNIDYKNDDSTLEDLSKFLAQYIFKLVGTDINKKINIEELKNTVINKNENNKSNISSKDIEYLEMFCGI